MNPISKVTWAVVGITLVLFIGGIVFISRAQKRPEQVAVAAEGNARTGAENGSVTLVEFGDFECPSCKAYEPVVRQLVEEFSADLTFVYRNFPLPQHRNARLAAVAAETAAVHGKYWEMHHKLFETQSEWTKASQPQDEFVKYAKELGIDGDKYRQDLLLEETAKKVQQDLEDGNSLGVNSTPTFFVNGQKINNPDSLEDFRTIIQAAKINSPIKSEASDKYHAHADIKVYLKGKPVDFSESKYQSDEDRELSPDIHFHDGNGDLFHLHKKDVPISKLFESFGMEFEENWLMYINGLPSVQKASYVPQDLDRILITDEAETSNKIADQIKSVTDIACIYSEKCPERGTPPTENCVGGLGTECEAKTE